MLKFCTDGFWSKNTIIKPVQVYVFVKEKACLVVALFLMKSLHSQSDREKEQNKLE